MYFKINQNNLQSLLIGFIIVCLIAVLSQIISNYLFLGAITCAILTGILVNQFFNLTNDVKLFSNFSEKKILNIAIIFMGAGLELSILKLINFKLLIFISILILISIISSLLIGRLLGLSNATSLLVGSGNAICGSAAIASISSIIDAKKEHTGLSIAGINLMGVILIFVLPLLLQFLSINSYDYQGIIIGSSIQAVGQVTAAGFMINNQVGEIAIFVKMLRILFLGPVMIIIASLFFIKSSKSKRDVSFRFPYFILGFIFIMFVCNTGLVPEPLIYLMNQLSFYLLILAMVSIGLNISFKTIFSDGHKIFSLTFLSFLVQFSFIIIFIKYFS